MVKEKKVSKIMRFEMDETEGIEGLGRYIQEQIINKWLMRKVYKCVELLDKGLTKNDVLSKVCPLGDFEEVKVDHKAWKKGKVNKITKKVMK